MELFSKSIREGKGLISCFMTATVCGWRMLTINGEGIREASGYIEQYIFVQVLVKQGLTFSNNQALYYCFMKCFIYTVYIFNSPMNYKVCMGEKKKQGALSSDRMVYDSSCSTFSL